MTYFFRQTQMAKGWGKEINSAWDEADHPRGKTTEASNSGSFAPRGGEGGLPPGAVEVPGSGGKAYQAPPDQAAPGGKYDPNYVNQENWTLSNKQPAPAEMRQHARDMGQHLRDMADNVPGANEKAQAFLDQVRGEYGKDYVRQMQQAAVDEYNNPAEGAREAARRDRADAIVADKEPPLGSGVKGTSYKVRDKVEVGAVLYTSWGYDQTNIDFYEVTGMSKSGKTVTIRPLGQKQSEDGFLSGHTRPILGNHVGEPMTKKILPGNKLKIHDYAYARLWDGVDKANSWGH